MKASDLLIEIRKIVREELSMAGVQPKNESVTEVRSAPPSKPVPPRPKKPIVSNPFLNEILTSTQPMHDDYSEWPTMARDSRSVAPMEIAGMSVNTLEQVAPEVASAVTRDYSELMKAIDRKKGK